LTVSAPSEFPFIFSYRLADFVDDMLAAKTFEQYRDISHRMFRDFAGKNSSSVASSAEGHVHRGTSSWGYASAVVSIAVLSRFIEYGLVPRLKKWVATPQSISASQEQFENVARATSRLLVAAPIPYLTLASTWSEISGDISASLRILGTGNEASEQELSAVASRLSFKVAQAAVKLLLYTEEQLESDILEAACAQDRLQEDGSSMSETASSRDNSQDHTERSGRSGSDAGSIISVGSSHGSNSLEDMLHRIRIARRASEASKAAAHDAETLALSEKGFDGNYSLPAAFDPREGSRRGSFDSIASKISSIFSEAGDRSHSRNGSISSMSSISSQYSTYEDNC
jgi:hypothetical protein